MISFFTTAKPFRGHEAIIQRNALQSWTLLHPDVEVILFGDDEGAAEVCRDLGLVYHPEVKRHESGAKQLDYIFRRASEIARHNYLCFSNCDIVLMPDFWNAFERACNWRKRFLLISRRWDIDITTPIAFARADWAQKLRESTLAHAVQRDEYWIDFFLFSKGLYLEMPPLIVGHCYWDNWMIWKALHDHVPVVDATRFVIPAHQNHGYNPKYGRLKGVATDELSKLNLQLVGGITNTRVVQSATHCLTRNGSVAPNPWRFADTLIPKPTRERIFYRAFLPLWHFFLDLSRPLRTALGLRPKKVRPGERA